MSPGMTTMNVTSPKPGKRKLTEMFTSEEAREARLKEVQESPDWETGREGMEFWPQVDQLRHVYAFRMKNGDRLRLISPPRARAGFSNLMSRTAEVEAP